MEDAYFRILVPLVRAVEGRGGEGEGRLWRSEERWDVAIDRSSQPALDIIW